MGGKERNKHAAKKLRAGRGTVGKTAVVGAKDRKTNKVKAKVVENTDAKTLQKFVADTAADGATVYSDDASKGQNNEGTAATKNVESRPVGNLDTHSASSILTRLLHCHLVAGHA